MACGKALSFCSCRIRHLCYPLESSPYLPPAQGPLFLTRVVPALMLVHSPSSVWSCLSPHPSLPYSEFLLPGKDPANLSFPFHLINFLSQPGLSLQFTSSKMTLKSLKFKSRIQDLLQSRRTERFMILCYHTKQMRITSAV